MSNRDWPLTPGDTYSIGRTSYLWNPKSSEKLIGCPADWDDEEYGKHPIELYSAAVKYCASGSCTESIDFEYERLPGSELDGECNHLNPWWEDVLSGFCTGEKAENYFFREHVTVIHGGGEMYLEVCGNLTGLILWGVNVELDDSEETVIIGDPIEDCLPPGVNHKLQVFGDDLETCGTLGIGGNLGTDKDRPGWFWVEVEDPFELGCPGFAGHPDLDGFDYEYPNFGLPIYTISGGAIKFDANGDIEYELAVGEYEVVWTDHPPARPEWSKWPERHTENGAWIGEVQVDYYTEPGGDDTDALDWYLELIWHQKDGLWMIMLFSPDGKPVKTGRSLWFDVFVNTAPIGACRLSLTQDEDDRTFIPARTSDINILDGEFVVELPDVGGP